MSLLDPKAREQFLSDIKSQENIDRKQQSLKDYDILNDNMYPYVKAYLESQFSADTVQEMPIVSSVNLAKRVANKEASIYRCPPERSFSKELNDAQVAELKEKYNEWKINQKLFKSNVYFKTQNQSCIMAVAKGGKLDVRVLMGHHYDVVPDAENSEIADTIVINSFDKSQANNKSSTSDNVNQKIADKDDYKSNKRMIAWDRENNFVFDGEGKMVKEVLENPLAEFKMLPFIDVAYDKDFEYFVNSGSPLTDFGIQYLGALSDLYNIMKMQGYSQAWMKGPKAMMPAGNIKLGPAYLLRLPTDGIDDKNVEFGFASPNSDLAGAISFIDVLLSNFLTSRGLDPSVVNGKMQAQKYASGTERLLAMVEMFEASQADYDLYKKVEEQLFELIKAWSQVTFDSDERILSFAIPEDAKITCEFSKPHIVLTEMDKLNLIARKLELNLITERQAIMDLYDIDEKAADAKLLELNSQMMAPLLKEKDVTEKIP